MCGRASLTKNEKQLELKFGKEFYTEDLERYLPIQNYNVAPTNMLPIIKSSATHFEFMRWGLIPFWAKDIKIGYKMINARIETIQEKNSYKNALKNRRCVVPLDGYYEWEKNKDGSKTPYRFILPKEELFLVAGVWESWKSPSGADIKSFTLITKDPIDKVKHVHNRMPALIIPGEETVWLDESVSPEQALASIRDLEPAELEFYPVSKAVGNVRNNSKDLVKPL